MELNRAPAILFGPQTDAQTRRTLAIASMALIVFRDPPESALGRAAG